MFRINRVSILYKSIAGRYRPVRVADGPITARYRVIKNASWEYAIKQLSVFLFDLVTFVTQRAIPVEWNLTKTKRDQSLNRKLNKYLGFKIKCHVAMNATGQ